MRRSLFLGVLLLVLASCAAQPPEAWVEIGYTTAAATIIEEPPFQHEEDIAEDEAAEDEIEPANTNPSNSPPPIITSIPEPPEVIILIECETELDEDPPWIPPERRPMIALTFDDGPSEYTDILIDLFLEYGGRATFCVLGYRVEGWAETVLRIAESGSEVIGHSWNHANLTQLGAEGITRQILNTSAAIEAVTGEPPPPIFRAPFGLTSPRVITVSEELGYSLLNWSIDPQDWLHRDAEHIYSHIMSRAVDGAVVVLHDVHPTTIEAMHRVIPDLIMQGFQLVTATELIEYFYGPLEAGIVYRGLR